MDIRRVTLGVVIVCYLASRGVSKSLDVVWVSPVERAVYNPGSTIIAKWSSSSPVVSPGFKLCLVSKSKITGEASSGMTNRSSDKEEGADGKCGVAIWPQVLESEGAFTVAM
jgi:hypothetical protein